MKNRKGLLLAEETLKIVIALIAISFLVYFLVSLYFSATAGQKLNHATASIERIKEVISNKQIPIEEVSDVTPPGWSVFSFVGEEKPNSCATESCLCVCPNSWFNQPKKCDAKGICEAVENLEHFEEIKIESPGITLEIIKSDYSVVVSRK